MLLFDKDSAKTNMEEIVKDLKEELRQVGTGKPDVNLLQSMDVEAYGSQMPLQSVAKVKVPDAMTVVVEVFNPSDIESVEKSLRDADLGGTVTVQGKTEIYIRFTPLTEEARKEKLPKIKKLVENARIEIRQVRQNIKQEVDGAEGVPEDDQRRSIDELQKLVDDYVKKIDEMGAKKEEEIMTMK